MKRTELGRPIYRGSEGGRAGEDHAGVTSAAKVG